MDIKELIIEVEKNRDNFLVIEKNCDIIREYLNKKEIDFPLVEWMTTQAQNGMVVAANLLGIIYDIGYGVEKNYEKAVEWFRKSADHGYSNAQKNLGDMYYNGFGVEKDYRVALEWYRISATQGNSRAFLHLGNLYYNGHGVEKDYSKAVELFRKSADQENPIGEYNLGLMYKNGYGIEKNIIEAIKCYQLSMQHGYEESQIPYNDLIKENPEIVGLMLSEEVDRSRDCESKLKVAEEELEILRFTAPIEGGGNYNVELIVVHSFQANLLNVIRLIAFRFGLRLCLIFTCRFR